MDHPVETIADRLGRTHCVTAWLVDGDAVTAQRGLLRQVGIPVLELNGVQDAEAAVWQEAATQFSTEFMTPVVLMGAPKGAFTPWDDVLRVARDRGHMVHDAAWLRTRQVALTRAVETSPLNREFRRTRARQGWIRIGWQPEPTLVAGNGLQLAWSSPLPLRRIRDFAARCPEITLHGAESEALATEVAAQGISVSGWRFAVK